VITETEDAVIQSMTGFGSAEKDAFKVEIRSVNHRFMDVSLKMPPNLSMHEMPLRNLIKEKFSRGRFDVMVMVVGEAGHRVKINAGLAKELYDALQSLKKELSLPDAIGVNTLSVFKDLILSEETEYDTGHLYEAFQEALSRLEEMRLGEGGALAHDMLSRLQKVRRMNDEVAQLCPNAIKACRERFLERLQGLFAEARFEEGRVLQEAAVMAEKTDISEEITRIRLHLSEIEKVLSGGETSGRKLEFLLQELNREVNTIASKANDYYISNISVEMKAELEKMRDQAQNIQ
jgi:uncharacterized protein (TIGR00255 family)